MRHKFFLRSMIGWIYIVTLGTGAVLGSEPETFPAPEWLVGTIDQSRYVGYGVSAATDPVTGETYISYVDHRDGELWLARTGAPTGNCGPRNSWECQLVDSTVYVGDYSSIAVGGPGPAAKLFISYHDATNEALRVLEGTVDRATGALTFSTAIVDGPVTPGSGVLFGRRTAVVVNVQGTAFVGYQVYAAHAQIIKLATRVASGTGNCGAGGWECEPLHAGTNIGEFIDVGLMDELVLPYIGFLNAEGAHTYPMLVSRTSSGGNCNLTDKWHCGQIRNGTDDTGEYLSFALDSGRSVHLAYRNATRESVEYARRVGSGGNCGSGDSWQCEWIDDVGFDTMPSGIDIEIDDSDQPIIAYQDVEATGVDLKIARPYPSGNCGPLGTLFFSWLCETLDAGDLTHSEAAGGLSIAMNADGEAVVAYREFFDAYIGPKGRVKVAIEPRPIFADGFESGNTSAWTSVTP